MKNIKLKVLSATLALSMIAAPMTNIAFAEQNEPAQVADQGENKTEEQENLGQAVTKAEEARDTAKTDLETAMGEFNALPWNEGKQAVEDINAIKLRLAEAEVELAKLNAKAAKILEEYALIKKELDDADNDAAKTSLYYEKLADAAGEGFDLKQNEADKKSALEIIAKRKEVLEARLNAVDEEKNANDAEIAKVKAVVDKAKELVVKNTILDIKEAELQNAKVALAEENLKVETAKYGKALTTLNELKGKKAEVEKNYETAKAAKEAADKNKEEAERAVKLAEHELAVFLIDAKKDLMKDAEIKEKTAELQRKVTEAGNVLKKAQEEATKANDDFNKADAEKTANANIDDEIKTAQETLDKAEKAKNKAAEELKKTGKKVEVPEAPAVDNKDEETIAKIKVELAKAEKLVGGIEALKEVLPKTYNKFKAEIDEALANANATIKVAKEFLANNR